MKTLTGLITIVATTLVLAGCEPLSEAENEAVDNGKAVIQNSSHSKAIRELDVSWTARGVNRVNRDTHHLSL